MVFAGTAITRGQGRVLVTAVGPATEMGRIARLASAAKPPPTPLQKRIGSLARMTAAAGVAITVVLGAAMLLQGSPLHEAFLVGVSVAVAAVPEGLAATVTIALALGAREMAKRGAIVRRLGAVETLGSATVVATDKTGTLTENILQLAALDPLAGVDESRLLTAGVLASTARLVEVQGSVEIAGDPIDAALLEVALSRGRSVEEPRAVGTLLREIPFDSNRRRMTLVYEDAQGIHAYAKGAPEAILSRSKLGDRERSRLEDRAADWARDGFRVVAVAERDLATEGPLTDDEIETDLVPLGLVALHDPPRETAVSAVAAAHEAGLRVEMLTGDHRLTALAVGRSLGLPAEVVHSRVTPEEKLRLVERRQAEGEIVAVTGDGVNDSPALRRADVGVAMGRSGTEAAREASDLVLTNDDFATIIAAIREGRTITDNIRKFVAFLLSANLGEVVMFTIAILAGLGAPMTVVQVLLVNVLTDGLPAVALARDPATSDTMTRGPDRTTRLFRTADWGALALVGALVGLAGLAAFIVGPGGDAAQMRGFATVALAELVLVFSMRSRIEHAWQGPRNPYLFAGVGLSLAAIGLMLFVPALRESLGMARLTPDELAVVIGLATLPTVAVEALKAAARRGWLREQTREKRSGERVSGPVRVASSTNWALPSRPRLRGERRHHHDLCSCLGCRRRRPLAHDHHHPGLRESLRGRDFHGGEQLPGSTLNRSTRSRAGKTPSAMPQRRSPHSSLAGLVPLVAYLLPLPPDSRFVAAALLTAATLFSVGAARSFMTGLSPLRSGLEMLLIGALAAVAAYLIGAFASLFTETDLGSSHAR